MPLLERSAAGGAAAAVARYLDSRLVEGWRPPESALEKVMAQLPSSLDEAKGAIRRRLAAIREQDEKSLESWLVRSEGGDPLRGRAIFSGAQAGCSTCHRVSGTGGLVGPDLTRIGATRSTRDLVESIVAPSSTQAQGYESYTVLTADGLTFTGTLARQTPELVVLVDSARNETRLKRADIEVMTRSATSIMPDGIAEKLAPGQFADLIAWLKSLK
jgi:putative heme-binding domain-containing protein